MPIYKDNSICIAIESYPEVRSFLKNQATGHFWVKGPTIGIDILPIRLNAKWDHLCSQLLKNRRGYPIGGSVSAIDNDTKPLQCQMVGKGIFEKDHIPPNGVVNPVGLSYLAGRRSKGVKVIRKDKLLDPIFHLVGKFEAVLREDFDPIVVVRIMRSRNDDTGIGSHAGRDERNAWSG
jgi:hypothetical protein